MILSKLCSKDQYNIMSSNRCFDLICSSENTKLIVIVRKIKYESLSKKDINKHYNKESP